jgi:hypothetical protein
MKLCTKCQVEKDGATDFHKDSRTGKARAWCRACTNADNLARAAADPDKHNARAKAWREANPEKWAATTKAWREANPDRVKANSIRTKYKVEWQTLWDQQQGLCACCGEAMLREGREKLSAVVDHDHKCCSGSTSCGKCVRGLVHWRCNLVLGYADDEPDLLQRAAAYLVKLAASAT